MSNFTDEAEDGLLTQLTGGAAYSITTPLQLALMSVAGTDAAAGTEVVGGSYARQDITVGAVAGGQVANDAIIRFDNMPATDVVAVEVYDSDPTTPKRIWHKTISTAAVTAGQPVEFAVGALTFTLA